MARVWLIVIKAILIAIIIAAMVVGAIVLAQLLQNDCRDNRLYYGRNRCTGINGITSRDQVFYITDICIPELFALISLIGVLCANQYCCQTSGIIIAIFWINDHQRNPQLFYYGTSLQISGHALELSVWVLLLVFAYIINVDHKYKKKSKPMPPSQTNRRTTNVGAPPYMSFVS